MSTRLVKKAAEEAHKSVLSGLEAFLDFEQMLKNGLQAGEMIPPEVSIRISQIKAHLREGLDWVDAIEES